MFKNSVSKLSVLGIGCGVIAGVVAAPSDISTTASTSTYISSGSQIFSKLSTEQIKAKVNSRYYVSQDIGRSIDSDPLFPGRSWPSYTFVGYEYFPSPELSYGVVVPYTYEKENYSRFKGDVISKVSGIVPYISYLITPKWLITGEASGFVEDYNETIYTSNPAFRLRHQVYTHQAGAYVTWIGPDQTFTATLRGGFIYSNQRYRGAFDNFGASYSSRRFETTAASISSRLKYYPDNDLWNAFLHVQGDFRLVATQRPDVVNPSSGMQNRFFQIGPGVQINLGKNLELRLMALHTIGFGYTKENRIGIRLRVAI